jgi:hypothetical protein
MGGHAADHPKFAVHLQARWTQHRDAHRADAVERVFRFFDQELLAEFPVDAVSTARL